MATIKERLKAGLKKMTDAEARIKRDEARHKEKIRKMTNKTEREVARAKLAVETMKRKAEVAKAKASLRRAQADQSQAGVALDHARQAHARSILGWALPIKKSLTPSPKTKKRAKKVGGALAKWWAGVGEPKSKPKPKAKRKPRRK